MAKISFEDFNQLLSFDVVENFACIEIEFCVDDDVNYNNCWMGKTIDKETNTAIYWYGLAPDGSQAYDFPAAEEFVNAGVFEGKSIKEIWNAITLSGIDGCEAAERVPFYLGLGLGHIRGPAM